MSGRLASTPGRLWLVGMISLLWTGSGALHYVMIRRGGDAYMRAMGASDAQIAQFHAMPDWALFAWGLGIWAAAAGSVLLLLRLKLAFPAFLLSLAGVLAGAVYSYGLVRAASSLTAQAIGMSVLVAAVALFLAWYAGFEARARVLR